ncbi:hypothetical protein FGD67_21360 [Colwellia sp. M166]|uniref:phosphoribosyltransferase family protein n=1 Tax=Colwellia sp. M166 TaxID=2583805 RepID=UPI00211E7A0A|nr:phosphoribosyltransferase family protein [Colwellia sp. M166]UUO25480.1 hypothetical protein FGD67_21360 [Colwellia sp. M166]
MMYPFESNSIEVRLIEAISELEPENTAFINAISNALNTTLEECKKGTKLLKLYKSIKQRSDIPTLNQQLKKLERFLLLNEMLNVEEFKSLSKVICNFDMTQNEHGDFVSYTGDFLESIANKYSLAKHGSYNEIKFFADQLSHLFIQEVMKEGGYWQKLFLKAKINNEHVVLFIPGSRNIDSTSNLTFELAIKNINIYLSRNSYPTIANVKIPRIDPPCENYASLTLSEREEVSKIQDHILPGENFYNGRKINVIFGDDVLITGATADKVYFDCMSKGAISFQSIYSVIINPLVANADPTIESKLNSSVITGKLDSSALYAFSHSNFVPVMKSFSFLLNSENTSDLKVFLSKIPDDNVKKLFVYAMSNGYFNENKYRNAMTILDGYVLEKGWF